MKQEENDFNSSNSAIFRINLESEVSYRRESIDGEDIVSFIGSADPALVEFLVYNQITKLQFKSAYGKIPKLFGSRNDPFALHFSDVTFLEINVNNFGHQDIMVFQNLTKEFSELVGGSFHSSYDFLKPVPWIEGEKVVGLSRLFPRERLNAEGFYHWMRLISLVGTRLSPTINKKLLHASPWYSLQLDVLEMHKIQDKDSRSFKFQLSIDVLINPVLSPLHQDFIENWRTEQLKPSDENAEFNLSEKCFLLNTVQPAPQISRKVQDSRILDFDVVTTISLPSHYSASAIVSVTEMIPIHYHFYFHNFSYQYLSHQFPNHSKVRDLSNLTSFTITSSSCERRQWSHPISNEKGNCDPSLQFLFELHPGDKFVYRWKGRKTLLRMSYYPPEASFGLQVLPAIIKIRLRREDEAEAMTAITESFLLNRPIPDLSMPYNVITLVGALAAFLIGTIWNAWIRKHTRKKQK